MKTAIIGAGNVGATTAMRLLEAGLCDVILLDIAESMAKGKAEDLMDAASLIGHKGTVTGTSDYADIAGSDIAIITAGFARAPGMSREELLKKNASIVKDVAGNIAKHLDNPVIIVVTNPLDVMAYVTYRSSSLNHKRVIGMAGLLDSSRMNLIISRVLNKPLSDISSMVLGTHGETMVPISSSAKVGDGALDGLAGPAEAAEIIRKTKARGAEIVSFLGRGSAFYAPSAAVFKMARAIIEDRGELMPCSCLLNGEYGIRDVYLGVPAVIGRGGVTAIREVKMSDNEKRLLSTASDSIHKQIRSLGLFTK